MISFVPTWYQHFKKIYYGIVQPPFYETDLLNHRAYSTSVPFMVSFNSFVNSRLTGLKPSKNKFEFPPRIWCPIRHFLWLRRKRKNRTYFGA